MFGKIKNGIDRGLVSVSVKSTTYLETEKLKTKIENVKNQMAEAASEMGNTVYEQWKAGEIKAEYMENVCQQMRQMEQEITGYQNEIQKLSWEQEKILGRNEEPERTQDGPVCTCGFQNEAGARFCVRCGSALQDQPKEEEKAAVSVCPACGKAVEPGSRFCMECGTPLQ